LLKCRVYGNGLQLRYNTSTSASSNQGPNASPPRRRGGAGVLIILLASAVVGAGIRAFTSDADSQSSSINPHTFTPFTLVSREPVSSTSSIFTFAHRGNPDATGALRDAWKRGVWSIQIKQPQLQIARAYTPLPPLADPSDAELGAIRLLIRKENKGEVSGYLHRLPLEALVELRGPSLEYELPNDVKEILFLAGGTGIAPALQITHALQDKARIHVMWATRRREDCRGGSSDTRQAPKVGMLAGWKGLFSQEQADLSNAQEGNHEQNAIVRQLQSAKERSKRIPGCELSVDYFVDEESSLITPQSVLQHTQSSKSPDSSTTQGRKLILVSGPEGFVNYWAGPKRWEGGREAQGPLGGVLSRLRLEGWEVWKL
ncbi:hypothetical protein LTR16_001910, partial [Cryomyces antarcticus]